MNKELYEVATLTRDGTSDHFPIFLPHSLKGHPNLIHRAVKSYFEKVQKRLGLKHSFPYAFTVRLKQPFTLTSEGDILEE